jgi:hypothetical protein
MVSRFTYTVCEGGLHYVLRGTVQVWSVHMHFDVRSFKNNHTSLKLSNFLATLHKRKTWYWSFCIECERSMMFHYIEEVHALQWCIRFILDSLRNWCTWSSSNSKSKALLQCLVDFQVSEVIAQSMFSIGRLHDDTHINASNVSSFNRLLRGSLFTQFCLENPRSHVVVLAKPELQSVPSRSCRVKSCKSYVMAWRKWSFFLF